MRGIARQALAVGVAVIFRVREDPVLTMKRPQRMERGDALLSIRKHGGKRWLVGQCVGWLVGGSIDKLVGRSIDRSDRSVGVSIDRLVRGSIGRVVDRPMDQSGLIDR